MVFPPSHLHLPGGPRSTPAAWKVQPVGPPCSFPLPRSSSSNLFSDCCLCLWVSHQQTHPREELGVGTHGCHGGSSAGQQGCVSPCGRCLGQTGRWAGGPRQRGEEEASGGQGKHCARMK